MRTLAIVAALAAALVLAAAAPAGAATKRLTAKLSGGAETPEPGDPNGRGRARLRLDRAEGTVCFTIRARRIDDVVAAHIHRGRRGVAGSIVVDLVTQPAAGRRFEGCTEDVEADLIRAINRHPRRFYVNVHTADYPAGAVRGQLRPRRRN